ncbi:potassium channel family protein [Georgenia yuyongxinii]|uniref:Two pore domain potassium channel family protein n=1 Tax=Georgenia yuyongxinii TaxID=2589797 RepID=A0A552WSW1_9MICO|nr:potassium channel family protein [Georgenia yuyongxinii]TRW45699.1 two pore domain potassium channel family protein [Georgenia yuyongxinii]
MEPLTPRHRRWLITRGLLRALATTVVMVALYYVLPLDRRSGAYVFAVLAVGVGLLAGMTAWQVRAIEYSDHPSIRAVQSLASLTPLFLLLFASTYLLLSRADPAMFTEELTRTDALYFTVTIFATVGFGDISAQSDTARLVVTIQMLLDLVVLGLGIQVILGAVKRGKASTGSEV